ncbi:MAG: phosphatidylinositol-specific phospholipase C/glycerophosphodiester phosphodiesterase family protein [Bacteroidales bacterium]|jgi:alkaline phosphatase|nr:phosphatidylinositol-specific phospholipase C/glycerophosphodiester phosphodiesterase family protein [Bacteroidales bacterium]
MKKYIFTLIFLVFCIRVGAQYTTLNAHSHNDYENEIPFWTAYNACFGSIEADIYAVDGELFVAHSRHEIKPERTLDALYIEPLKLCYKQNKNKAWPNSDGKLQLMIDLKTPCIPTLDILVDKLNKFPEIFDPSVNSNAVRIVITGNSPKPADFDKYPSFIWFDGLLNQTYTPEQLERVALYSMPWSVAKGKAMTTDDQKKIENMIFTVHKSGKKIRFWAAEDHPEAWRMLMKLKVDFINTDKINELAEFLNNSQEQMSQSVRSRNDLSEKQFVQR